MGDKTASSDPALMSAKIMERLMQAPESSSASSAQIPETVSGSAILGSSLMEKLHALQEEAKLQPKLTPTPKVAPSRREKVDPAGTLAQKILERLSMPTAPAVREEP